MPSPDLTPVARFEARCVAGNRVEVVFGSPRHDCAGMGVCRIEPDVWDRTTVCPPGQNCHRSVAFAAGDEFGRLQLHFPIATLTVEVRNRYFAGDYFHVPDPAPLPDWLAEEIGHEVDAAYQIAPSRYPVLETPTLLTVSLRLMIAERNVTGTLSRAA